MDSRQLREAALYYHRQPKPGKIAVTPIKQLTNQYDLSLAYSPGVAFACEEIVADPGEASTLTSRGKQHVASLDRGRSASGRGTAKQQLCVVRAEVPNLHKPATIAGGRLRVYPAKNDRRLGKPDHALQ